MLSEQKNAADGAVVRKKSFAGERASTADKMKLATAKEMLENGADSETVRRETVRRETGWFKGYDGKWRFEIDDSDIKYHLIASSLMILMYADMLTLWKRFIFLVPQHSKNRMSLLHLIKN